MELAALRRLVTALARQGATMTEGERAAACARIARVRGSGRGGVPADGARLLRTGNRRRHQRSHSQRALDTARQMMAIGQTRDLAANYLDTQDKRIVALRNPVVSPRRPRVVPASSFDALIEKYASLHQVESAVVRAIIETESAFQSVGAVA